MKAQYILVILSLLISISVVTAQPNVMWTKSYGPEIFERQEITSIEHTVNGGYIMAGTRIYPDSTNSSYVAWLLKTDANLDTLWTRKFENEWGIKARQTSDGGYILLCWSRIIKTASNGEHVWSRTLHTVDEKDILETRDGGFLILGHGMNEIILLKMNQNGDSLWSKTIDYGFPTQGYSMVQTEDSGIIISGLSISNAWLLKMSASRDSLWKKEYGTISSGMVSHRLFQVIRTRDGGFMLMYRRHIGNGRILIHLEKTDEEGNQEWLRFYDFPFLDWPQQNGIDIAEHPEGGFICLGADDNYVDFNTFLFRTNEMGEVLWSKTIPRQMMWWPFQVIHTDNNSSLSLGLVQIYAQSKIQNLGYCTDFIEIDDNGKTLTNKNYGNMLTWGSSIISTSDGGFITTGSTDMLGNGLGDIWLLKTDEDGDTLWTRTFGGTGQDFGHRIEQTSDEGYIIGGITYNPTSESDYDGMLIKTNDRGEEIWSRTYGGSNMDVIYSIAQIREGGFIFAGKTGNYNIQAGFKAWIVRTDNFGNEIWSLTYGDNPYESVVNRIIQISDGTVMLAGSWADSLWLMRMDLSGKTISRKVFDYQGYGVSLIQENDSTIVVTSVSAGGAVLFLKTNLNGDVMLERYHASQFKAYETIATSDGSYLTIGEQNNTGNSYLIKTDSAGNEIWSGMYPGLRGFSLTVAQDGSIVVTGTSFITQYAYPTLHLMKLEPDSGTISALPIKNNIPEKFQLFQNYPNPFNPITTIEFNLSKTSEVTLKIFNILGEEVVSLLSASLLSGTHSVEFDASHLTSGVYLYRLTAEGFVQTRKMVVMK